jgi:hypothetical protein
VQVVAISLRKEFGPERPSKRGEPSRQEAHFVGADEPGVYLLKATFARPDADGVEKAADKGAWSGKRLETPAIRVEMVK